MPIDESRPSAVIEHTGRVERRTATDAASDNCEASSAPDRARRVVRDRGRHVTRRHRVCAARSAHLGDAVASLVAPLPCRVVVEVSREQFESFVVDALDSIPESFAHQVENVAFLVEEESEQGNLFGLYEGIPLTKRGDRYAGAMPDRITIYMRPMLRVCRTVDEVREQVHDTVVHELGHYFGLGDARLRELGW
jgi:predicted Zn-dependent protease with MMP-like domain